MLFAPSLQCKHWLGPACTILAEACAAILQKFPRVPAPGLSIGNMSTSVLLRLPLNQAQRQSLAQSIPCSVDVALCAGLLGAAPIGLQNQKVADAPFWYQRLGTSLLHSCAMACSAALRPPDLCSHHSKMGSECLVTATVYPQRFRRGWKRMRTASPLRWTTAMRSVTLLEADQRALQLVPFIQWTYHSKQGSLSRERSSIRSCKRSFVSSSANHVQLNALLSGAQGALEQTVPQYHDVQVLSATADGNMQGRLKNALPEPQDSAGAR
jgi:hypothetical protein